MISPLQIARRQLTLATHRIFTMPVLVLSPHSRCNCRCVMCDIWRANDRKTELSCAELRPHLESMRRLRVEWVVLTGGEALMHSGLGRLCALLREARVRITLLSTGLMLGRLASNVVQWCDDVIVSLDGSPPIHDEIRNVPRAYARLAEGVAALKEAHSGYRVTARSVIQRRNYRHLLELVETAIALELDGLSLLPADVSSQAFNRPRPWDGERVAEVALDLDEARELEGLIETLIDRHASLFTSGWIAESPAKMRALGQYYFALNGRGELPTTTCNAPWVSAVVEPDGTLRPCFFHPPIGSVHDAPLHELLNAPAAVAFRRNLDVRRDPICRRCVCTLQLAPWASSGAAD